jgi:hypothetical protein
MLCACALPCVTITITATTGCQEHCNDPETCGFHQRS